MVPETTDQRMALMALFALELTTFGGLPLHPLIVHLPVVLVPLALIGAVAALVRPPWRSWCLPLVAALSGASLVGVQLAIMSGEGLEELNDEESALIERHSHLAEQARPLVLLFFLVATALAVAAWLARRDRSDASASAGGSSRTATLARLVLPLCILSVLTGALATTWVYRTGHTGAESVWKGEGGDKGGDKASDRDRDGDQPVTTSGDGDDDGD